MKETEKLNEKQIESVKRYMSERLGKYGVESYKITHQKESEGCVSFTQVLPENVLGIFKHALKECIIEGQVWLSKDESPKVTLHVSYKHIDGGRNGCSLGIKFLVDFDGEVMEL